MSALAVDSALPIAAHAEEIARLVQANPVVVVAGETGSGKTTQLPKILLALGRRHIGHTQPRRLAARSVATRIADELAEPLGATVGYQVRFTRTTSAATQLKVMTDGILLAEIGHDRQLRRYDTIIIDEAHERSLNIDFLLGYLKQLLPKRPDLKVVITSATIDTARFAAHFGDAPVVEVSGRTYPVEVRYRPLAADEADDEAEDLDQAGAIVTALRELRRTERGDVLVFLSGEREIKDAAKAIADARLPDVEVLPLFARLSLEEQNRVFTPHGGQRVVLATNVAETSLTVPGIRAVIDPGTARISRYSARTKVQRLPIEPISRASANQRAGRCGRVAPGVCVRLYSEDDFLARPEFTEPEILRTNLASVILQMAAARLGDIADFPFVEAPDRSHVVDGLRLLEELGAIAGTGPVRLTRLGRQLAGLPIDPRLGRMMIEGAKRRCLKEVIVLVAGLTIQDPRERPADHREAADACHARFADGPGGDFGALLRLWRHLRDQRKALSSSQFRKLCRREYLNYLRVREWQDLVTQLRGFAKDLGLRLNGAPGALDDILQACLSGLLSHIGALLEPKAPVNGRKARGPREYEGPRGARFALSRGSVLAKTPPDFVMAVELVETTRLWAHTAAAIEPEWAERLGGDLVKRSYSEPRFVAESGTVVADEKVTLLGVTLAAGRRVGYARINPAEARQLFLQAALVEDRWRPLRGTPGAALQAQHRAVRRDIADLEDKARRRDLLVDDWTLYSFFDARVPESVTSAAALDRWLRADPANPRALELTLADLLRPGVDEATTDDYPLVWTSGPHLPLTYEFAPGEERDGVTVTVPLAQLAALRPAPFTWGVPGQRRELATALIKSLPKSERTRFVPAPDWAARAVAWLDRDGDPAQPFPDELARALEALSGGAVTGWDWAAVPDHLRVGFLVRDGRKETFGRDLPELQATLVRKVERRLAQVSDRPRRSGTTWLFEKLPERVTVRDRGAVAPAFPCLRDDRTAVSEVLQATEAAARRLHPGGLVRLLWFALPDPTRWCVAHLSNTDKLSLATGPYPSVAELVADARLAALGQLVAAAGDPWTVRDAAAFAALADAIRPENPERVQKIVGTAATVLAKQAAVELKLAPFAGTDLGDDVRAQLDDLVFPGFLRVIPEPWFWRLPVYLQAIDARLTAAAQNP
ncbi:MAG: ATP-dependent RNA helicase HrpA, partial [Propionibacteriaceae bacterium]|nr:ATP-dependent RNA helicase HrpA [Propionibacteriaceae bacterium]